MVYIKTIIHLSVGESGGYLVIVKYNKYNVKLQDIIISLVLINTQVFGLPGT